MIPRALASFLKKSATRYPIVTVTGPRQSGKTTLVRSVFDRHDYASLEDPDLRAFAAEDPRGFLAQYTGPVVLDEVQRAPDPFSYIQTAVAFGHETRLANDLGMLGEGRAAACMKPMAIDPGVMQACTRPIRVCGRVASVDLRSMRICMGVM